MINVSTTGNTKSFSKAQWCTVLSEKEIDCAIFPDFKYKVDSFNLYIIDNYVKRTIGRCIPRIENIKTINKVHLPYYFFFSII